MKKYTTLIFLVSLWLPGLTQDLAFLSQPQDGVTCMNSSHYFFVETDTAGFGGSEMVYLWFENFGAGWQQVISDANHYPEGAMLKLVNIPEGFQGNSYFCEVQIGEHSFTSETVILSVNVAPPVNFDAENFCFGDVTTFTNTTEESETFESWHWKFNDLTNPDSVLTSDAAHIFSAPGRYNVMLSGIDINGCYSNVSKEIKINRTPEPVISGPDIACSFQQNVKFNCNDDFAAYQWSVLGDEGYMTVVEESAVTSIVTIDCKQAFVPLQFDIALNVIDENSCQASVSKEFLMLKYKSPEKGDLIQKPNNSKMLVCLLEDSADKVFNWFIVEKGTTNIVETFTTTDNFIVLDDAIDTATFEYGVEVIDPTENNCSSSFYLNDDNSNDVNQNK